MHLVYPIIRPNANGNVKRNPWKSLAANDLSADAGRLGERGLARSSAPPGQARRWEELVPGLRGLNRNHRPGWAVREVLAVLFILGVFAMLLFPWLLSQRENARRNQCERRLTLTGQAIMLFDEDYGALPGYANPQAPGDPRSPPTGWLFPCLPYLNAMGPDGGPDGDRPYLDLYRQYGPLGAEELRRTRPEQRIPLVICPSDPHVADGPRNLISWAANCGTPDQPDQSPPDNPAAGVFETHWPQQFPPPPVDELKSLSYVSQHDGVEFTLLLVETNNGRRWDDFEELLVGVVWVRDVNAQRDWGVGLGRINERPLPENSDADSTLWQARPNSGHGRGANALFADGRVQFLNQAIDYGAYVNLLTSDFEHAQLD